MILSAAERWIDLGFLPIPVPAGKKAPVVPGWQTLRLTRETLHQYFNGEPQNVGVLLGDGRGSADIDCDCTEAVVAARHLAPNTGMVFGRKSKPASHYFYRCTPAIRSHKFLDPMDKSMIVELRCQTADGSIGLHTIVPPSVHPSGEPIRFEAGGDGEPAELSPSTLGRAVAKIAAAAVLARHWPAYGSRHVAFLALAGCLSRARWTLEDVTAFHCAIYDILWPGLSDMAACTQEVASTFQKRQEDGETTGFRTLSELIDPKILRVALGWIEVTEGTQHIEAIDWRKPVPFLTRIMNPFTADLFPGCLGEMVNAVSKATETPIELPGMLGLAVMAACVAGKVVVSPELGYQEPVNIYTAVAMESGNRKTAVLNAMTAPLLEWEHSESDRLSTENRRATSERKTQEIQVEALRKKAAKDPGDATITRKIAEIESALPDIPALPRLFVQDVTPERLGVLLAEQHERLALLSDEGGIFDVLGGRYSKGIPNLDLFLQAHSGSSVRIDRGSRPPVLLRRPALTIGISPQPQILQSLSARPEFRGRGLLARFLYGLPPSPLGFRTLDPNPVPARVGSAYGIRVLELLGLDPGLDGEGRPSLLRLEFSPDAYGFWKDFQRLIEALMKEGGKLFTLKDWASKLPGAAARIAGIMHCVCVNPNEYCTIELAVTEQAVQLATALIDQALAAFDLMQRDPVIEDALRLLRWIRRQPDAKFTIRDCFCAHQGHFKKVDEMQPAIHLLERHEYIRLAPKPKTGGRPSEIYEVNPNVGVG